jgi:type I restriction enzyme M protein
VLFFDKAPLSASPATERLWVYDLRSDRNFSLRQNPIRSDDLKDFVNCYRADDLTKRRETASFRRFRYSDIMARDRANLDVQWGQTTSSTNDSPTPQALMKEILTDLEEAMKEFAAAEAEIRR